MKTYINSKNSIYTWISFFVVVFLGIALWSSFYRAFNHDEFEAIHSAWKIHAGETIYTDFLQHHHPLTYITLIPLFDLFGETAQMVLATRISMYMLAVGIVYMTYKIACCVFDQKTALMAVFFLVSTVTFLQKIIEIRPDILLVFFELISVYCFILFFQDTRKKGMLVISSVALFIAFLSLQKAVFLAFLLGIFFLFSLWIRKVGWRDFLLYWGVFFIGLLVFLWRAHELFGLSEYIFMNWIINTKLLNTFPLYKYLLFSFKENPVLWILFFITVFNSAVVLYTTFRKEGSLQSLKNISATNRKTMLRGLVFFFSIGLLLTIFLTKSPFPQYYLTSFPFIAMIVAWKAQTLLSPRKKLFVSVIILSSAWSIYILFSDWKDNTFQLKQIEFVLSNTDADDFVYDGDAQFNLFRKDIDYFWYSVKPDTGVLASYKLFRDYDYDINRLLREKKPKIISGSFVNEKKNTFIQENYIPVKEYKNIFIRK